MNNMLRLILIPATLCFLGCTKEYWKKWNSLDHGYGVEVTVNGEEYRNVYHPVILITHQNCIAHHQYSEDLGEYILDYMNTGIYRTQNPDAGMVCKLGFSASKADPFTKGDSFNLSYDGKSGHTRGVSHFFFSDYAYVNNPELMESSSASFTITKIESRIIEMSFTFYTKLTDKDKETTYQGEGRIRALLETFE